MTTNAPRAAWAPALLLGAAAAIAAEVAGAILLYAGPGFMRSLTTVLAVEGVALAAGLQTAPNLPSGDRSGLVERLRRRWLLCFGAFAASAMFGTLWSLIESLGEGRLGQGLGLALLAGLPLFACGAVLGGMGAATESDATGRLTRPGPAAALGAGMGFAVTGALLPRAPIPASLLVGCLVLLSASGMLYGAMLAEHPGSPEPLADTGLYPQAPPEAAVASDSGEVVRVDSEPGSPPAS
jgi:hypothetical protein